MIRRLPCIVLCGVAAGCAGAAAEPPRGPPQIHFESHQQSLGEIAVTPAGDPGHEARFTVSNRGLSPLHIQRLVSSCKCTRATVSSPLLPPGETGFVSVFVSSQQAEESSASVQVHSNDPARPNATLHVSWRAVAPVEFDPLTLDFGSVRPDQERSREVRVVRRGDGCEIARIEAHPPGQVRAKYGGDRINVVLVPGSAPQHGSGYLTVYVRDCWRDELVIPVRWQVQADLEAVPPTLFVSAAPGTACSKSIVISARPGETLDVERVEFARPEVDANVELRTAGPNRVLARINWRLAAQPGVYENEIVITCRAAEQCTLVVPVAIYASEEAP